MFRPTHFCASLLPLAWLLSAPCHALIVISDEEFIARGGDLRALDASLPPVFAQLRALSLAHPFYTVGLLSGPKGYCSATWLGDSRDGRRSYLLSAAHCFDDHSRTISSFRGRFTGWSGQELASGAGQVHIHPDYLTRAPGESGVPNDLALIVLPKTAILRDSEQQPVAPPWLNDEEQELGQAVEWVGYGLWEVKHADRLHRGAQPPAAERRAWAQSQISSTSYQGRALQSRGWLQPRQPWAQTAPGDSGSAWWQQRNGVWSLAAISFGSYDQTTTGARISRKLPWIRTLYPQVASYAQRITLRPMAPLNLPDNWHRPRRGAIAYLVPPPGRGPVNLLAQGSATQSQISVPLVSQNFFKEYHVKLRASHCGNQEINDARPCNGSPQLRISYHREDNPTLPPGRYRGDFVLEARGTLDAAYRQPLGLRADIQVD